MKQLPEKFDDKATEKKWQDYWLKSGVYNWIDNSINYQPSTDNFVIDTPPPTISGSLHMGHIFSYTQTDFVARYKRMRGYNVFYPMGFDDNGLPTERLVEKERKTKAHLHSREDFIKMCNETVEKYRVEFRDLFKSIALSVDWNQEYHTISDEVRKISQMSFLDLYNKNEAYRALEPMFWDPVDQTAIAQAEIEEKELDSFENYIWFGLRVKEGENKGKFVRLSGESSEFRVQYCDQSDPEWFKGIEVMTTRPELLPACVAFMYHPEDSLAEILKNCEAITPLFQAIVPTVADEAVQKDKGTGVVMCCTFGDEQDVRWWKKYKLGIRILLNKFGKIDFLLSKVDGASDDNHIQLNYPLEEGIYESLFNNKNSIENFNCLNISEAILQIQKLKDLKTFQTSKENIPPARLKAIELLEQNGFTAKDKKKVTHPVKCAERSGSSLEIIPTNQWFIKVLEHKEQLKKKAQECNWNPSFMVKRIEQWIDSLSWDWCISRQRYFGVPFPVWYSKRAGEEGKILLPKLEQLPVNPITDLPEGYSADEVTPDFDVMDTWATSSVSPQISSKGINLGQNSLSLRERVGVRAENKIYSPKELIENARDLRQNSTDVENLLWYFLRNRNLNGYKFRRQHPIEKYVLDFVCLEANLVIELDGGQHNEEKNIKYDEERTKLLEGKGFKVLRFWNSDVNQNLEGVLETIYSNLKERCPHPNPLPEGEGIYSENVFAVDANRHKQLFPADLRPQAHEIIRTWAFYTIVKAYLHEDKIPWKNLMISGWCLAEDKTKMSKSKGNIVTPQSILEENSADVVRYWASTSRLGADTAFSRDVLKVGKKLVNKLWNATKFASIHFNLIKEKPTTAKDFIERNLISEAVDKWVISSLTRTIQKATEDLDAYEYSLARLATEEFFWKDFCDNYLEIVKARTYNEEPQNQQSRLSAIYTIYFCLNAILKLFAPFIPHITEELYSHLFDENNSVHSRGNWVKEQDYKIDEESEKVGKYTIEVLEQIRKIKAEENVSIKKPTITTINTNESVASKLKLVEKDLVNVTSSTEIIYDKNNSSEVVVTLKFVEE